jgi:hypothetical protein
LEKPLIFKLFTFSVLCAKTIIRAKAKSIIIDTEYIGHERQIKSFILQIFKMKDFQEPVIRFTQIGKKSAAHRGAYTALMKKKSDIKISSSEVLKYYDRINKK